MAQGRSAQAINPSRKKRGSITYSTDGENKVCKIFIISLETFWQPKQTFELSGPYSEVWPTKLTNHSTHTDTLVVKP